MSLPVSQYEALLAEVRGLRRKAQHVQQLAIPLISHASETNNYEVSSVPLCLTNMESLNKLDKTSPLNCEVVPHRSATSELFSNDEFVNHDPSHMSVSSEPVSHKPKDLSLLYNGTWPVEKTLWSSDPTSNSCIPNSSQNTDLRQETNSVISFGSYGGIPFDKLTNPSTSQTTSQQLEAKVDMVYSLLAMLSGQEHADMGDTLLALSTNPESCYAMRESGCIPLLIQMIQSDKDSETRSKASQALHNLIQHLPDEKQRKREGRIFKLLEQLRIYTEGLQTGNVPAYFGEGDGLHPVQTVAHIMKLSFDESHRHSICQFGGIHTIASLIEAEYIHHSNKISETHCMLMRRYSCMALTNLTFGDSGNKSLLCSFKEFMRALVAQLQTSSDELRQVTASVLRNLSWRADTSSKDVLREVGSVSGLMKSAMFDNKENTLKSILSALWNLSAHCTENKTEICMVEGALGFLVDMLTYKTPSKSLAIIENSGGILRNISSQIAINNEYRKILRQHNCLQILLDQLKSPSLTIVSNACGTLWNLSAKCTTDQEILWQLGAPAMLRSLNHSKHKMIAMGSSAALRNLLSVRPQQSLLPPVDSTALSMDLPALPTLGARKQKALIQDLDQNLSETCENIEKDFSLKKNNISTNEFSQILPNQCSKDDSNLVKSQTENTSYNLKINEPSTSFNKAKFNLPGSRISNAKVSSESVNHRSFLKNMPKIIAKTDLVTNKDFSDIYNGCNKSEENMTSMTDSINNETLADNVKSKLKEDSNHFDEKDSCSVEDVESQDADVSDELSNETINKKEYNYLDVQKLNILVSTEDQRTQIQNSEICEDEVDVEDISVYFSTADGVDYEKLPFNQEHYVEKRDIEKEEELNASVSDESNDIEIYNVNRKSKQNFTCIPVRTNPAIIERKCNSITDDKLQEILEVQNIDINLDDSPLSCPGVANVNDASSSNLRCSELKTIDGCFSKPNKAENNTPTSEMHQNQSFSESFVFDNTSEYTYLSTDNLVAKSERDRLLERSCEETNRLVDNRMLDPDAMIESLERFTAELVSQASSHLQNKWEKPSDNTWNDQTSSNEMTFPSISNSPPNVITFESENSPKMDQIYGLQEEYQSNDFSSVNTSTMTESTLIAIEANKMAKAFKTEADFQSSTGFPSDSDSGHSSSNQKAKIFHKKCPVNLVKRALNNSLSNNGSSVESLENHSLSNLDQMNPPSILDDLDNMEGSMVSVASLPSENPYKTDFMINGTISRNNPLFHRFSNVGDATICVSDLENVNPPSIFNEITDLCNSLADIPTETICSEMEIYEDCQTHVGETTAGDDVTEFSDANSITPIQSDMEFSPEATPKRTRNLSKSLTLKQRRNTARDRYKTYTVAAEIIMQEETEKLKSSTSDDFKTADCFSTNRSLNDMTNVSPMLNSSSKLTPRERRQNDRSRFETRVIDEATTNLLQQTISNSSSGSAQPNKDKPSIRNNFLQKRSKNQDRFKTQTISTSALLTSYPSDEHLMVQKEANLVLNTLKDIKTVDELLDCETLSLVSNDDDSEINCSSVNYRTYHKSWGLHKANIPEIHPQKVPNEVVLDAEDEAKTKPKITKPSEECKNLLENESKGIRGRRKPLYSKSNINTRAVPKALKPVKTITSTVVKDVTSSLKSASKKKTVSKPNKVLSKPPISQSRASSGYGTRPSSSTISPARKIAIAKVSPKQVPKQPITVPVLERQGTFTKDTTKSKIPGSTKIPSRPARSATSTNKIPPKSILPKSGLVKSASSDRANRDIRASYSRSASADSKEAITARRLQNTTLISKIATSATKKSLIPQQSTLRSNSSTNLNENSARKQVTSKIANLWKKIEESKNQPTKKDTRVWIQTENVEDNNEPSAALTSDTAAICNQIL